MPQTAELVVSGSFTSPKTHIPRFDSGPLLAFEHASERPSFHMVSFQASRNDVAHPELRSGVVATQQSPVIVIDLVPGESQ